MRMSEIMEAGKGYVGAVLTSLDGVTKRFKDPYSKEATEWRNSYQKKPRTVAAPRVEKPNDLDVWYEIDQITARAIEGIDPMDLLGPYINKHGLTLDYIDLVVQKHSNATGLYDYIADVWAEYQADQVSDARRGNTDRDSPFYDIGPDGSITPTENLWRLS